MKKGEKQEVEKLAAHLFELCEDADELLAIHKASAEDGLMLAAYLFCKAEKVFLSAYPGDEKARRFFSVRFARCVENARKHKIA
jgi:hypothetical protein